MEPFRLTPDGEDRFRHLGTKLGFIMQQLAEEGMFEGDTDGNVLTFQATMQERDSGREYDVLVSVKEDDEDILTSFGSKDIADEKDLLSRIRSTIAYFVSKLSKDGLDRVNARYGFLAEQDLPQGSC
jgi:hypothetical protein